MSEKQKLDLEEEEPPKRILVEAEIPAEILALPQQFQAFLEALRAEFSALDSKSSAMEARLQAIIEDQKRMIKALNTEVGVLRDAVRISMMEISESVDSYSQDITRFQGNTSLELDRIDGFVLTEQANVATRINYAISEASASTSLMSSCEDKITKLQQELLMLAGKVDCSLDSSPAGDLERLSERLKVLEGKAAAQAASPSPIPRAVNSKGDKSTAMLELSGRVVKIDSRLRKLEGSEILGPLASPPLSQAGARKSGGRGTVRPAPSSTPSASAATSDSAADRVSATASGALEPQPWLTAVKKKSARSGLLSAEEIKTAPKPLDLLLVKAPLRKTTAIMATILSAPLRGAAKGHPYASWRSILQAATGSSPLLISMTDSSSCEAFWDVSSEATRTTILAALEVQGIRASEPVLTMADRPRRLRAYLGAFFPMLREATLTGLDVASQEWILERVMGKFRSSSGDVATKKAWLKRVSRDRVAFGLPAADRSGIKSQTWPDLPSTTPQGSAVGVGCVTATLGSADVDSSCTAKPQSSTLPVPTVRFDRSEEVESAPDYSDPDVLGPEDVDTESDMDFNDA